jgi:hypothetical protein
MEDAARSIVTQFPRIKALVYFSSGTCTTPNLMSFHSCYANTCYSGSYPLDSSTNALEGARRGFGGCGSSGTTDGNSNVSQAANVSGPFVLLLLFVMTALVLVQ